MSKTFLHNLTDCRTHLTFTNKSRIWTDLRSMLKNSWLKFSFRLIGPNMTGGGKRGHKSPSLFPAFLSPEAAILLISTKNWDLWKIPTPEVFDLWTHCQIWQIWLAENYRKNFLHMLKNFGLARGLCSWCRPKGSGLWGREFVSSSWVVYPCGQLPAPGFLFFWRNYTLQTWCIFFVSQIYLQQYWLNSTMQGKCWS